MPRIKLEQDYRRLRVADYPAVGDQLDALWKGFEALAKGEPMPEAEAMLARVNAVKARFPKPKN